MNGANLGLKLLREVKVEGLDEVCDHKQVIGEL